MNKIYLDGVDLSKFVKKVYELSSPVGLGMLHFREGELSDKDAENIVKGAEPDYPLSHTTSRVPIRMDYVNGRCCKMNVFRDEDGKLYIHDSWYDHSKYQFEELLKHIGIRK